MFLLFPANCWGTWKAGGGGGDVASSPLCSGRFLRAVSARAGEDAANGVRDAACRGREKPRTNACAH
eukprot:5357880-Pyramimonas_sp.AAC.1